MKNRKLRRRLISMIFLAAIIYLQHVQLSYSATVSIGRILKMNPLWQLFNCMIAGLTVLITLVLVKKLKPSLLISSLIITIASITNYYILLFHGRPFMADDFYSIRTALNVLSEYQLSIDQIIIRLVIIFAAELVLILLSHFVFLKEQDVSVKRKYSVPALVIDLAAVWLIFFSPWTLFPRSLFSWSWGPAVNEYGYELSFCNSAYLLNHKLVIPEGYSAELLKENKNTEIGKKRDYPDIILILNETLCDLSFYSSIPEGAEVLEPLKEIPGMITGYSTVSLVGGGTNNSEYELLTSNSMSGLSISAPFLALNMNEANSVVSYLHSLGYHTTGMHCGNKSNYGRSTAYYAIGFDDVYLGKEQFANYQEYGNRPWLDSDNYLDLIQAYKNGGDGPRFVYLLTYQNHGGYQQNDAQLDTVSIAQDIGEYTDDVNEYLTSIQQSVEAFEELINYYEKSEREAVILMVGDHAPSFIQSLPVNSGMQNLESAISQRTVPYFVWTNTEIDLSSFSERSTMVDLMPMLFDSAGLPLTDYYQTILDLNKKVPVRTYSGVAMDAEGNVFRIEKGEKYYDQIHYYFCMEYNNLLKGNDYRKELFELTK